MDSGAVQPTLQAPADVPPHPKPARKRSLKQITISGSIWVLCGHAGEQALRLVSSLVMTRLLFPEAFGIMVLVQMVLHLLQMFSDMGLASSIMRHKRGDEPDFLNTAWTIQVVRGLVLCGLTCAAAWPMAQFYEEPALVWLLPTVGLTTILMGFGSTSALLARRHVNARPLVVRDLAAKVVSLCAMIAWAVMWPSVWALVIGSLVKAAMEMGLSYFYLPGPRPRFRWDRAAASDMFRYGRWIFLSTAITFLLSEGDKAILGKILGADKTFLGVFAIAALWSRALINAMTTLNGRVLLPVFARVANEKPDQLRRQVFRVRLTLLSATVPILWFLAIWGKQIIGLLYDPRYADAGWMLQILAIGSIGATINVTSAGVLLAVGDSFRFMLLQVCRGVLVIAGIWIGFQFYGLEGLLMGIACAKIVEYPVLAWTIRPYGTWLPLLDCGVFCLSGIVIGLGHWLK